MAGRPCLGGWSKRQKGSQDAGVLNPFLIEVTQLRNYTLTDEKKNLNQPLNKLLKQHKVHHFVANKVKAFVIQSFNTMLKNEMWRYFIAYINFHYIDHLSKFIKS